MMGILINEEINFPTRFHFVSVTDRSKVVSRLTHFSITLSLPSPPTPHWINVSISIFPVIIRDR